MTLRRFMFTGLIAMVSFWSVSCGDDPVTTDDPCPDPAAVSINFEIVDRVGFEATARITGVVKNVGGLYDSDEGQQSINLYEKPLGGTSRLVATTNFTDVGAGDSVTVMWERAWNASSPAEGEFPPTYVLTISYDPDISIDGKSTNDDCGLANNEIERSGSFINDLFN